VEFLSTGLGVGMAVIVATLVLRIVVLPVSWSVAYRGCIRQKKLLRLQPELDRLKAKYAGKPDQYFEHLQSLYKKNGLSLVDNKSLLGSAAQMPLMLGMFQVLRDVGDGARFLWVSNLIKPDLIFSIVAGATTALMMSVNPDLPEQMRVVMIIVPSIIAFLFALKFCSALALYWATSNCFSAMQTVVLHRIVGRRIRAGEITL
jgi:YidC/Oxa1 family membrane protein insertase